MPTFRLATFNAENLFSRPKAMLHESWSTGKQDLDDFAQMSNLIEEETYTAAVKAKLHTLLNRQLYDKPAAQRTIKLNEARNKLVNRSGNTTTIVPNGRAGWVGWFELIRDELEGIEVVNTGRVINAVRPDVLCLVEVEDRPSLGRFNDQVMQYEYQYPFRQYMLIDGNDERGIDISLLSQRPILGVRSYTDLPRPGKTEPVFSRDCPEYTVELAGGQTLVVLGCHFKSQGYGNKASNDAKRLDQANATATIYQAALQRTPYVAAMGDLNAGPNDPSVAPLVKNAGLKDVMAHPGYQGLPGTFGTGTNQDRQKFDYILLSPQLWAKVQVVGVERRGVYAPNTFPHFPEVTSKVTQASDHASVWVDLGL